MSIHARNTMAIPDKTTPNPRRLTYEAVEWYTSRIADNVGLVPCSNQNLQPICTNTGPDLDNCQTISPVIVDVIVQEYLTITPQLHRAILEGTITQVQLFGIV